MESGLGERLPPHLPTELVLIALVGLVVYFLVLLLNSLRHHAASTTPTPNDKSNETVKEKTPIIPPVTKQSKKKPHSAPHWKSVKNNFNHPFLATNLMGHTGKILGMDCSSDGKYLVTCAEDRTVFFWDIKDIQGKGRKSVRVNIEFDHGTHIAWSPDDKAFIIHKYLENCIEVYKIEKKKDGLPCTTTKAITFEKMHLEETVGFGIACNGRFMMSCSTKNDIIIWSLKGEQLARIDTYTMTTMKAKISPCARYVAASGFVPDVKVWEIVFDKTGKFKHVARAFELTGHNSGVYDFAFDAGTSHMATVSKDGTWKLFYTKVDYVRGEMVQLINTGTYTQGSSPSIISLSPKADLLIIGTGNSLEILKAQSGDVIETIDDAFADDVTNIRFDLLGKLLLVSGDNKVRIFNNTFQ
ncbi:transducin beta-like protein 2 isoform X7 [Arctopsyche grandis]|uniref:transducin beta-like protein 2 isoform X7 n=1 Tax=Arctopsyche grandis TaxID=121162 RepID=UPI00406D8A64